MDLCIADILKPTSPLPPGECSPAFPPHRGASLEDTTNWLTSNNQSRSYSPPRYSTENIANNDNIGQIDQNDFSWVNCMTMTRWFEFMVGDKICEMMFYTYMYIHVERHVWIRRIPEDTVIIIMDNHKNIEGLEVRSQLSRLFQS